MLYNVKLKKKNEEPTEFIYGAENNKDTITKVLTFISAEIGENIDKYELIEWKELKKNDPI